MKKGFIFTLIAVIFLGFLASRVCYLYIFKKPISDDNCYIISSNNKNTKNANNTYYVNDKKSSSKYYGISSNINNAKKLKDIYNKMGIDVEIKKTYVSNEEFISNLKQYDILLSGVDKEGDLISINKVILSSYEDLVLNN